MTDLRNELERIAERAPVVAVSPDLYARARRASARARTVSLAAGAACVVLLVGGLAVRPWSTDAGPQPADGHQAPSVVPDRIYVPRDQASLPLDAPTTPDPMSAPVVAAYVLDGLQPTAVLIHGDGSYGRVSLRGLAQGMEAGSQAFALSPDGRHLAYYSRGKRPGTTSISVVDFGAFTTDGSSSSGSWGAHAAHVGGESGALVSTLRWSANSLWIAWSGQPVRAWHGAMTSYSSKEIAGRLRVDSTSEPLPHIAGGWAPAGICDDGTVVVKNASGTWSWAGGRVARSGPGSHDVLATGCVAGQTRSVLNADVPDGDPRGVLGWTSDGAPVVEAEGIDGSGNANQFNVVVLRPGQDPGGPAGTADLGAGRLTLATGLMTSAHPTESLPKPPWAPGHVGRWRGIGGLVVGAAVAAAIDARRRRRRKLSW